MKEESEKAGLKFNIQKSKILAFGPITSWQIGGETMETVTDYFLGLQNKRCLLLGRKAMPNLDSIVKSRDLTLPTKFCIVKTGVMYGCESCTTKKAEQGKIDALGMWCWRRLKCPLNSREIKPVNLKGNQP